MTADIERIEEFAHELRQFLEPRWVAWKSERTVLKDGETIPMSEDGNPVSDRMCRLTTVFCLKALKERFPEIQWTPIQGMESFHPEDRGAIPYESHRPGGILGRDGEWHDHMWIEGETESGTIVVDLTGDQFGHDPVIVTTDKSNYRKNWKDSYTSEHIRSDTQSAVDWLNEWKASEFTP